jgi:cytochrome c oxidase subunit 3/cytochrome o ubiquinol oxidase subunit 3
MVLAHNASLDKDYPRMRLWLAGTAMLGLTFVGGQVFEFTAFYREGLALSTNLFGTTFYVLTGFHGVHVTVGVLMLLILVVMSWRGSLSDEPAFPVEMVGLYWHFVDIVWIVIFTLVYLIPSPQGPIR